MPVVKLSCVIDVPAYALWTELRRPEELGSGLPEVGGARLLGADGNERRTEWSLLLRGSPLRWIQKELADPGDQKVRVELLAGDLKHLSGYWQVAETDGGSRTDLELEMDFGFARVAAVLDPLLKEAVTAVARGVLARAARCASGRAHLSSQPEPAP